MAKADKLTAKQEKFVTEYLTNGQNATAAYRVAYNVRKMSEQAVNTEACELLQNPKIARRVSAAAQQVAKRAEVNAARVLEEAARIALSDLREVFDEHMNLKPVGEWPDGLAAAVSSVEVTSVGSPESGLKYVTKVRMWPKAQALDMLMKHLGLFERDNAQRRPNESMTDEQLRDAVTDALRVAGIPAPVAGIAAPELPGESGSVH